MNFYVLLRKRWLISIFILGRLQFLYSEDRKIEDFSESTSLSSCQPALFYLDVHQTEKKGIGYNTGYTTLSLFALPLRAEYNIIPFVDLRGHRFDDNRFALNTGIGVRYRAKPSCLLGANLYYDWRQTDHKNFSQLGGGVEVLAKRWDFRANCYFPLSSMSPYYNVEVSEGFSSPYFSGNSLYLTQSNYLHQESDVALKGGDAELGVYLKKNHRSFLYFGAGPYYYLGKKNQHALGGKARIGVQLFSYFSIEARGSYDSLFGRILQGRIGFSVPLERKKKGRNTAKSCDSIYLVSQRAQRSEIIVTSKTSETSGAPGGGQVAAINPLTGEPYQFYFVDNTSSSSGTYEDPFHSLVDAQNASAEYDIIYVYPGDGTSTGMDAGITLKNYQRLWGTGYSYSLPIQGGQVLTLSALSTGRPLIENAGGTAVTLASSNLVQGLNIGSCTNGVQSTGVSNATIENNLFTGTETLRGITLGNISGTVVISDNTLTVDDVLVSSRGIGISCDGATTLTISRNTLNDHRLNGVAIDLNDGSTSTLIISNNTIAAASVTSTSGVVINPSGTSSSTITIDSNTISNHADYNILIQPVATVTVNASILSNVLTGQTGSTSSEGITIGCSSSSSITALIEGNTLTNHAVYSFNLSATENSHLTSTLRSNTATSAAGATSPQAVRLHTIDASTMVATISSNSYTNHTYGINLNGGSSVSSTVNIQNNQFTDVENALNLPEVKGSYTISNNTITVNDALTSAQAMFLSCTGTSNTVVISGNELNNHPNTGINVNLATGSTSTLTISGNTVVAATAPTGTNGIQVNTQGNSVGTVSISSNISSGHADSNIRVFPTDTSSLNLTVSNNTLTGKASSTSSEGLTVGCSTNAVVTALVEGNTATNHNQNSINIYGSDDTQLTLTVLDNNLTSASGATNSRGVQIGPNGSTVATATIRGNTCIGHTNYGVSLFAANNSQLQNIIVDANTITAPSGVTNTNALNLSGSGTGQIINAVVSNNVCSGHSNSGIQCYATENAVSTISVEDNAFTSASGVVGTYGVSSGPSNSATMTLTVSGNTFTGHTYGVNYYGGNDRTSTITVQNNTVIGPVDLTNSSGISINAGETGTVVTTINNNTCNGQLTNISSFASGTSHIEITATSNTLTGPSGVANTIGMNIGPNTTATMEATINGNTFRDHVGGLSANSGGTSTLEITVEDNIMYGPAGVASTNAITVGTYETGTLTLATITGNQCSDYSGNAISANIGNNDGAVTTNVVAVSNNTITGKLGVPLSGIAVTAENKADLTTTITNNDLIDLEGIGINTLSAGASNITSFTVSGNTLTALSSLGGAYGILSNPFGASQHTAVIDNNSVTGFGLVGIVGTNQGATNNTVTITNNIVSNCGHTGVAPNPASGIATAVLGSGKLTAIVHGNTMTNNAPQGFLGLGSAALGGTGQTCLSLHDNSSDTGYSLVNPGAATDFILDNVNNTGTISYTPDSSAFTPGTCP